MNSSSLILTMDDAHPQAGAASEQPSEQPSALRLRAAVQQRRLAIAAANAAGGAQAQQQPTAAAKFLQSLQPAAPLHRQPVVAVKQPVVEVPWICYFCDLEIEREASPIFHYPRTCALQQQFAALAYHPNCYRGVLRRWQATRGQGTFGKATRNGATYVDETLKRPAAVLPEGFEGGPTALSGGTIWQPTALRPHDAHPPCSASKGGPASGASTEGAASSGSKRPREVEAPCLAGSDAESD